MKASVAWEIRINSRPIVPVHGHSIFALRAREEPQDWYRSGARDVKKPRVITDECNALVYDIGHLMDGRAAYGRSAPNLVIIPTSERDDVEPKVL